VPVLDLEPNSTATIFDELESNVRSYCRRFPVVFTGARGHLLTDANGRVYLDFIAGAGALNYGHNHPVLKQALIRYLSEDGPIQSLDLHTAAKAEFLRRFRDVILAPRGLEYRVQFTGPTGANCVEAALKVARRATGRPGVVAFTGGFHGGSIGALAASANLAKRAAAGTALSGVVHLPYDGYLDGALDTIAYLEAVLDDPSSGVEAPAAIVLETVQGEGGLGTASTEWLGRLERAARQRGILLIIDDIQAGCGRTGRFFSFEEAGLTPDLICLAKSIGGYGLPMALTLIRPDLDVLRPGEHAGTFRGQNLSFVAATAALDLWARPDFAGALTDRCAQLAGRLAGWQRRFRALGLTAKGRGMFRGLAFRRADTAGLLAAAAFEKGLLVETSGARGQVLKIMPPIVIEPAALDEGLDILEELLVAADARAADGEGETR
jgi:diaminobutyrate-2-oxoglutarate transaminase